MLGTHASYLGGSVYNMPLTAENNFYQICRRFLLTCYPKPKFWCSIIPITRRAHRRLGLSLSKWWHLRAHDLIIVQDAAYASLIFEGQPLSILQIPGAKDVAVELHSLSKSYNMTGWRIGFVVGNPLIVKAYGDMKDNTDSGQFLAIQQAAATALEHPQITEEIAAKYSRRMDWLVDALKLAGFDASKPKGSFFLYIAAPKSACKGDERIEFESGEAFSQWLITELPISTVPWDNCGQFVRFSVTFAAKGETAERAIISEIADRLNAYSFQF